MLLFDIFLFILGLVFGSFLSALTWRIPRGLSFAKGRSICPKCRNKISWYGNIPLLSFAVLGGKCRHCGKKISFRYPAIEIISGISFILIFNLTNAGLVNLIFYLVLFLILFSILIIDLENQLIPDSLVFTGIGVLFLYIILFNQAELFSLLFAGLISAVFLLIIHLATKGKGMGLGDVKFAIFGGMLTGIRLLPVWLLLAFLTGAFAGTILILVGKAKLKTKIAFGPFLVIGIALAFLFGEKIFEIFNYL